MLWDNKHETKSRGIDFLIPSVLLSFSGRSTSHVLRSVLPWIWATCICELYVSRKNCSVILDCTVVRRLWMILSVAIDSSSLYLSIDLAGYYLWRQLGLHRRPSPGPTVEFHEEPPVIQPFFYGLCWSIWGGSSLISWVALILTHPGPSRCVRKALVCRATPGRPPWYDHELANFCWTNTNPEKSYTSMNSAFSVKMAAAILNINGIRSFVPVTWVSMKKKQNLGTAQCSRLTPPPCLTYLGTLSRIFEPKVEFEHF